MENRTIKIEVPTTTYVEVETTVLDWLVENVAEVRRWSEFEIDVYRDTDRYDSRKLLERICTMHTNEINDAELVEFDVDPRGFWERNMKHLPDLLEYEMGIVE